MTEELDTLLAYIEKDGGFRDACITLQQRPLSVLEGDLQNFLELLQVFKVIELFSSRSSMLLVQNCYLTCLILISRTN
jgi:hypothetical protein